MCSASGRFHASYFVFLLFHLVDDEASVHGFCSASEKKCYCWIFRLIECDICCSATIILVEVKIIVFYFPYLKNYLILLFFRYSRPMLTAAGVITLIVMIVGVMGNLLTVVALLRNSKIRTVAAAFITR